jgi:hypothetical protein
MSEQKDGSVIQMANVLAPMRRVGSPKDTKEQAQRQRDIERFTAEDSIIKVLKDDKRDPFCLLRSIQDQIAEEAASIRFYRVEESRLGKATEQLSTQRIRALKDLAAIELKIREMGEVALDPKSPQFLKVFKLWVEMITEAASVLPEESRDVFLNKLTSVMEGWEEKAVLALRS